MKILLLVLFVVVRAQAAFVQGPPLSADVALPSSALSAAPLSPALGAPAVLDAALSAAAPAFSPSRPPASPSAKILRAPTLPVGTAPAEDHVDRPLELVFASLDAAFHLPENSPTATVRSKIRAQLLAAARELDAPEMNLLEVVAIESDRALVRIQTRLDAGEIDPNRQIRTSKSDPELPVRPEHMRIGVYPVAADPFQWGHLIIALRAVGDLGLDKVVFVLAGDDPRKPTMTRAARRHPMGQEVLAAFEPFFAYSPIAVGTNVDGETNIFRILELNASQGVEAWYMVGDDHYRLVDKNGNPDTLPKLERNLTAHHKVVSPTLHALKVAFMKREDVITPVPTQLVVQFLDHVGFEASSTQVRNGRHTLLPFSSIEYSRQRGDWLYGIAPGAGVSDRRSQPRSGAPRRKRDRVK